MPGSACTAAPCTRCANGRVQQFLDRAYRSAGYPQELASVELARAEADLRHALELDPTLVEARIRLAHVVGDLGRPDDAVALATEALRAKLPPFFEGYASLILGRNQLGRGASRRPAPRSSAAPRWRRRPGAAHRPIPGRAGGRTPGGGPGRAHRLPRAGALRRGRGRGQVWESYYRVHDPEATEQLAALRAEVP